MEGKTELKLTKIFWSVRFGLDKNRKIHNIVQSQLQPNRKEFEEKNSFLFFGEHFRATEQLT